MTQESTTTELTADAEDYRQALLTLRDDKASSAKWSTWVRLLECQYALPDRKITSLQLSKYARMKSFSEANLRYGELGHALANHLGYEPPRRKPGDGRPRWWMTISTGESDAEEGANFAFTMRPALAEALELMKWVRPTVPAE
jgi:hypothetical protein